MGEMLALTERQRPGENWVCFGCSEGKSQDRQSEAEEVDGRAGSGTADRWPIGPSIDRTHQQTEAVHCPALQSLKWAG